MTMYETSDLRRRIERYEAALEELRSAHQDVRSVLLDQVLYERWHQLGAELGFTGNGQVAGAAPAGQYHQSPAQQIPQLSESWAG